MMNGKLLYKSYRLNLFAYFVEMELHKFLSEPHLRKL